MDAQKLRSKASHKIEDAREILQKAEQEQRDLSEEEAGLWERYHKEAKELLRQAERLEAQAASEADLAKPQNEPVPPDHEARAKPNIEVNEKRFNRMADFYQAVIRYAAGTRHDSKLVRNLIDWQEECRSTGMSESIPSDGGFLVPDEFVRDIRQTLWDTGALLSRVTRIPSNSGGTLKIPGVDESSRADGYRRGGIQAYWVSEGGEIPSSKPKFNMIEFGTNKIAASVSLTEELQMDAPALEAWLTQAVPEELRFAVERSIFEGDGAGKPLGIMNSGAVVTVSQEDGQAPGTIKAENIFKMWARCIGRNRSNAVWFINQDIEPQLFTMSISVGTGGIPVYLPANGMSDSPYGRLLGRPVIPIEHCESVGTRGDIVLFDMSEYGLRERGEIQTASSIHVRFQYDENVMRFTWRVDGQPLVTNPTSPVKGNPLSPFVALETRG